MWRVNFYIIRQKESGGALDILFNMNVILTKSCLSLEENMHNSSELVFSRKMLNRSFCIMMHFRKKEN